MLTPKINIARATTDDFPGLVQDGFKRTYDDLNALLRRIQTLESPTDTTSDGSYTASYFISTIAIGTAPFQATSTTVCPNLNASFLGGNAASAFATSSHTHTGVYEPANANIQSHISSTSNPHSVTKAQVGLGSVENTALSTWVGTTNITTLGAIASGTWNATTIAIAKGGTGAISLTSGYVPYSSGGTVYAASPIYTDATSVSIGTTTISAKLAVESLTEQFRASYNASNYFKITVASDGITTFAGSANYLRFRNVTNNASFLFDRSSTSNYNWLVFQTAGVDKWAFYHYDATEDMNFYAGGAVRNFYMSSMNVAVGVPFGTAPLGKLHVQSTTTQFIAGYDASNYLSITQAGAGGNCTFAVTGGGSLRFNTTTIIQNQLDLGVVSSQTGSAFFFLSTSAFSIKITTSAITANRTFSLPDVTGTAITTGNLTSITAVGTIASGTWQGIAIAAAYIGAHTHLTADMTDIASAATGITKVGTINTGVWQGSAISDTYLATISTAGKVSGTAITSGNISTSGQIKSTNAVAFEAGSASVIGVVKLVYGASGFYGILRPSLALTDAHTWTFPNASGTIITTGNPTDINSAAGYLTSAWGSTSAATNPTLKRTLTINGVSVQVATYD